MESVKSVNKNVKVMFSEEFILFSKLLGTSIIGIILGHTLGENLTIGLQIAQIFAYTAAGIFSCVGIYKFMETKFKNKVKKKIKDSFDC